MALEPKRKMPETFSQKIEAFCVAEGIEIPSGFFRHSASRYALIEVSVTPSKLIAKTWFNQEDVVYYLQHHGVARQFRILDFKDRVQFSFSSTQRLVRGNVF